MDISEADRLTRDFAQHAKLDTKLESVVRPRGASTTVLTLSALLILMLVAVMAIALR